jgi:aldehyde:ferredoxin oxidoreductase
VFDEYYKEAGWDVKTGWPTRAKYEALGLKDVADTMQSLGKLP